MEVLEYLLSVGANVSLTDEDGDTPLLVCELPEIFERLIQAGADPNAKNSEGKGIINKAVEDDNEVLINHLQARGFITDPNFKYTPMGDNDDNENNLENLVDMMERVDEGEDNNEEDSDGDGGGGDGDNEMNS